jgi:CRISPR-associated exonuclease Cas4
MSEETCGSKVEAAEEERRPYAESDLLPLSRLADIEFCERRAALHLVEQVWEDNVHTAQGTALHGMVHELTGTEVRGDIRIARGLMIHSFRLGLIGKADVVEFHRSTDESAQPGQGETARLPNARGWWRPFPVEYKPGRLKTQRSFQIQLCAQAMCLEEMLGVAVPKGALFYGKSARRQEVVFDAALRSETAEMAARLHALFEAGRTPPAVYEKKCESCSLLPVCKPRVTGGDRSARKHLDRAILESLAAQAEAEDGCAPRGARGLKET